MVARRAPAPFRNLAVGAYSVIVADPPWRFQVYSENGRGKSADQHYVCQDLDWIKSLPVASLAMPDCVLFLWTTSPMLRHAFDVLDAWGFTYKSQGVWVKLTKDSKGPAFGTGYIFRNCQEPFLVATRGSPKRLSRSERDVILSPRREHSRKPDQMIDKIENLYQGPYCELFSRTPRLKWASWGTEREGKLFAT